MPTSAVTTLKLKAYRSHFVDKPGNRTFVVGGASLGLTQISCPATVTSARNVIIAFGQTIAEKHPGLSFAINVTVVGRKPVGFDRQYAIDGLGTDNWMQVLTKAESNALMTGERV